ncbi:MAG: hypothetical protein LBQ31_09305 [Bacteroidales bacterium]|jgi:hypothetical protein|nr:hypothetical protein [Bacteroidales bacterium]
MYIYNNEYFKVEKIDENTPLDISFRGSISMYKDGSVLKVILPNLPTTGMMSSGQLYKDSSGNLKIAP